MTFRKFIINILPLGLVNWAIQNTGRKCTYSLYDSFTGEYKKNRLGLCWEVENGVFIISDKEQRLIKFREDLKRIADDNEKELAEVSENNKKELVK